jgi:hypothetical protein
VEELDRDVAWEMEATSTLAWEQGSGAEELLPCRLHGRRGVLRAVEELAGAGGGRRWRGKAPPRRIGGAQWEWRRGRRSHRWDRAELDRRRWCGFF